MSEQMNDVQNERLASLLQWRAAAETTVVEALNNVRQLIKRRAYGEARDAATSVFEIIRMLPQIDGYIEEQEQQEG